MCLVICIKAIDHGFACIEKIVHELDESDVLIVTADHGGHDRTHGTDMVEDMKIPIIMYGGSVRKGFALQDVSIMDIAPTVTKILGVPANKDWEGKSLF